MNLPTVYRLTLSGFLERNHVASPLVHGVRQFGNGPFRISTGHLNLGVTELLSDETHVLTLIEELATEAMSERVVHFYAKWDSRPRHSGVTTIIGCPAASWFVQRWRLSADSEAGEMDRMVPRK